MISLRRSLLTLGTVVALCASTPCYARKGGRGNPPPNNPPNASFVLSCTDLACDFDASGSTDADGTITDYAWDFGNGVSASGLTSSYTYAAAGSYTVTLTVTDSASATGTASDTVNATDPDPGPDPDPTEQSWDRKNTNQNQFILRGESGQIANIAAQYGLTVVENVVSSSPGGDVALLEGPEVMTEAQVLAMLEPDVSVLSSESVELASLPQALLDQSTSAILEQSTSAILESINATGVTSDAILASHFAGQVWAGYTDQPAAQVLNIASAHANSYGAGTVAVIDNGVDPNHPLLQGALVNGYDFILDQSGTPSEWANLDQSTSAILEQSTSAILEQSTSAILEGNTGFFLLEQSTSAILEQSTSAILEQHQLPPSFGHGTMVAGIIRLVAPAAQIMPLRAFDGAGTGNLFDIVRAVHYAVDNGADVINMSFSLASYSPELARAIDYARRNGVICVAAAGNQGAQKSAYPAAFGTTIGVGSTNDLDQLSSFSNHGADLVLVTAPGEGVISTYPGGTYAAGWGTSFSAPFVAGTLALIHNEPDIPEGTGGGGSTSGAEGQSYRVAAFFQAMSAVSQGSQFLTELTAEVSIGRLDAAATVGIALLNN